MKLFEFRTNSPIYVRLHKLCVGDVILSGGHGFISQTIKFSTRSKYSHAAIYIGHGRYLESTGELGVTVGHFPLIQLQSEAGKYIGLVEGVAAFDVFRHNSISDETASWTPDFKLHSQLQPAYLGELGRHYSKLGRMLEVEQVDNLSKKLGAYAKNLQVVDGVGHSDGVFCSELVSLVLEKFVKEQVIPGLKPENTSPAAFSRFEDSFRLVEVVDKLPDYRMSEREVQKMEEINQHPLNEMYRLLGVFQRKIIKKQDTIQFLAKSRNPK